MGKKYGKCIRKRVASADRVITAGPTFVCASEQLVVVFPHSVVQRIHSFRP